MIRLGPTWVELLQAAHAAAEGGDEDGAARELTGAICALLRQDRAGRLATRERIQAIGAAYKASGRRVRDLI